MTGTCERTLTAAAARWVRSGSCDCVCLAVVVRFSTSDRWLILQTTLGCTRTMFGRHSSGALFPILLCVKPSDNCFVGVIQQLMTPDQCVPVPRLSAVERVPS